MSWHRAWQLAWLKAWLSRVRRAVGAFIASPREFFARKREEPCDAPIGALSANKREQVVVKEHTTEIMGDERDEIQ